MIQTNIKKLKTPFSDLAKTSAQLKGGLYIKDSTIHDVNFIMNNTSNDDITLSRCTICNKIKNLWYLAYKRNSFDVNNPRPAHAIICSDCLITHQPFMHGMFKKGFILISNRGEVIK